MDFYCRLFLTDIRTIIPELEILASNSAKIEPFQRMMMEVDMAYAETTGKDCIPKTLEMWNKALLGHLVIYLMRELNAQSSKALVEADELADSLVKASELR